MKTCNRCNLSKDISCFRKGIRTKDGLRGQCKACEAQRQNERREKEPEKYRSIRSSSARRRRETARKWARKNTPRILEKNAARRARLNSRTPKWLTRKQKSEMKFIYEQARVMTESSGVSHHVDHIIPLLGKDVCGLHVPWNLQILPAYENLKKSNMMGGY